MEELLKYRDESRERYFKQLESMGYDRRTTGDINMDKVLSFAYNWGLAEGAMAEKRGESVI